jgi:hypothetical protein
MANSSPLPFMGCDMAPAVAQRREAMSVLHGGRITEKRKERGHVGEAGVAQQEPFGRSHGAIVARCPRSRDRQASRLNLLR